MQSCRVRRAESDPLGMSLSSDTRKPIARKWPLHWSIKGQQDLAYGRSRGEIASPDKDESSLLLTNTGPTRLASNASGVAFSHVRRV